LPEAGKACVFAIAVGFSDFVVELAKGDEIVVDVDVSRFAVESTGCPKQRDPFFAKAGQGSLSKIKDVVGPGVKSSKTQRRARNELSDEMI